ncbi:MAG TPA: MFS transporter [Chloroflexota bacterium]
MRLWVAQAITQTTQNAIWYALLVLVEETSHSTTQLGITILSVVIPSVFFGVPAGVYVDRWDKRLVLVISNLGRAVIVVGYVIFGSVLALLYLVSFAFSMVSQFFAPAELAMIPAVVGRRGLMQATSLFHLTFTASQLLGLVLLGPLLVKLLGTGSFFVAAAALYAVSGLLVTALPHETSVAGPDTNRHPVHEMFEQVRDVGRQLLQDQVMLWAMAYWTVGVTLTLVIAMLGPRFVVDVLNLQAGDTVFVLGPGLLGTVGTAIALSRSTPGNWTDRHRLIRRGLIVTAFAVGLIGTVPAIARTFGIFRAEGHAFFQFGEPSDLTVIGATMVLAAVGGAGFTAMMIAAQTALQERAPPDARGRIFAVQLMLGNLASIVPLMFIGGLADLVGVEQGLRLMAIAIVAIGLLGQRFAPVESAPGEAAPADEP